MSILVNDIIIPIRAALDAEGSDRYDFSLDLQPALNYAVRMSIDICGRLLSEKKIANERLRENTFTYCIQTSKYSRVFIPNNLFSVNTVLGVYIGISVITTDPVAGTVIEFKDWSKVANTTDGSLLLDHHSVYDWGYSCKRITAEERTECKTNRFVAGYNQENVSLTTWAYMDFSINGNGNYGGYNPSTDEGSEIEIVPTYIEKPCALMVLVNPPLLQESNENDFLAATVMLPDVMIPFLVNLMLRFLSIKQNDASNIYNISAADIAQIVKLMR